MKTQRKLPSNFRMPDGYKRKFIFEQPGLKLVIEAKPPRTVIFEEISEDENSGSKTLVRDWMNMVVGTIINERKRK